MRIYFTYFWAVFSPFFVSWQNFAPAIKRENISSTTRAKQTQNLPTLAPFWVFCLICCILCGWWRERTVGPKLEWIKSEIEFDIFSSVMIILYMLKALLCCPLAVMPTNLMRKSDKIHFDSGKKSLSQLHVVPLSILLLPLDLSFGQEWWDRGQAEMLFREESVSTSSKQTWACKKRQSWRSQGFRKVKGLENTK